MKLIFTLLLVQFAWAKGGGLPWDERPLETPLLHQVYGVYPPVDTVPESYVLQNESLVESLDRCADKRRTVVFTTLRFSDPESPSGYEAIGMVANFCYWLQHQSLLKHTMLITTDERTWGALHKRGFPAFLDRAFPRRNAYASSILPPDTYNREFDVQKHWWGWRLSSLNYRVLYMDSDALVLRNPLQPFDSGYDIQGLSDWKEIDIKLGTPGERSCGMYALTPEPRASLGSMLRETFTMHPAEVQLPTITPCQSTGLWYLEPTNAAIAFMRAVVDRIAYHAVFQWDQTAWNEIVMSYVIGTGGEQPPLKYSLLPNAQYSNIGVYRERRAHGLGTASVILHLGHVHGPEKKQIYIEEGLYHPEFTIVGVSEEVVQGQEWAVGVLGAGKSILSTWSGAWLVAVAFGMGVFLGKKFRPRRAYCLHSIKS